MKLLDVVASLEDCPERYVARGQVGTIVEELDDGNVLVEFSDLDGVAYATAPMQVGKLIALKHTPVKDSGLWLG